jgi:pimeloyl-ACP methyl ester carboxylesterase
MVFLHPMPLDNSCWLYQMSHFSTWFRTLSIDMPGWGRSPAAPGITMSQAAELCWQTIDDQAAGEPVVLCGVSVGWHVAVHMAKARPERILALVLSGCGYRTVDYTARRTSYEEQGLAVRFDHALYDFSPAFRETPMARYFARIFTERNASADQPTIVDWFHAFDEPDPVDEMNAPTLIITGSEDHSHPFAEALRKRIRGSEMVTLQGAGHACNMEQPWAWDEHCLRFLRQQGILAES